MSLSALRLALVLAAFVGVPGWLATGAAFRRGRLLHAGFVGFGVHVAGLVVASWVTSHARTLPVVLGIATYGIAAAAGLVVRRRGDGWRGAPPTLGAAGAGALLAALLVAAVLRWLHNYHFDDLQHLLYLTEIRRLDELFPGKFMLLLAQMHLPLIGEGQFVVARYPYWAVSQVVLGRLAGVPLGDAYFILGLAHLALALGVFAAVIKSLWSSREAVLGLALLLLGGCLLSDNLLNFGGYPFQAGKLMVFAGAAALCGLWRTGAVGFLLYAVLALSLAPLLHTNNLVGVVWVIGVALLLVVMGSRVRTRVLAVSAGTLGAMLLVAVLGSLATGGFLRWVPKERVNASTTANTPRYVAQPLPIAEGRKDAQSDGASAVEAPLLRQAKPDRVSRRIGLFAARGAPTELLVPAAGITLCLWLGPVLRRRAETGLLVVAGLAVATVCGGSIVRQAVIVAFKPGYFALRSSLVSIRPVVGSAPLTDPLTHVMGSAAGRPLREEPPMQLQDQSSLLLLFHPLVRGELLGTLLSNQTHSVVVVDEGVLGAGVAAKFASVAGVTPLAAAGAEPSRGVNAEQAAASLLRRLNARDPTAVVDTLRAGAQAVMQIARGRSLRVYLVPHLESGEARPFAEMLTPVATGLAALEAGPTGQLDIQPFLGVGTGSLEAAQRLHGGHSAVSGRPRHLRRSGSDLAGDADAAGDAGRSLHGHSRSGDEGGGAIRAAAVRSTPAVDLHAWRRDV